MARLMSLLIMEEVMDIVKWEDIEAECEGFRDGFVRTYLKYEGRKTDEIDASNRVVKVTQASFARHFGIAQQTFNDWVKEYKKVLPVSGSTSRTPSKQTASQTQTTRPAHPPVALVASRGLPQRTLIEQLEEIHDGLVDFAVNLPPKIKSKREQTELLKKLTTIDQTTAHVRSLIDGSGDND
jgi:transposase-like protein